MTAINLMNQVAKWYQQTEFDKYGEKVSGDGVDIKVRFQKTAKTKLIANGEVAYITGIVYASPELGIVIDDRIDYSDLKYRVFSVNESVDGNGNVSHLKMELTKWQN